jgi:hypothetical protein
MAQKKLESIEIRPAENGGHVVRHEFKRQVVNRKGAMNGGFESERPPSEEHVFGPDQHQEVLSHIASVLGVKKAAEAKEEGGEK